MRPFKTKKPGKLGPQTLGVGFYIFLREELTLHRFPARVPDHPRSPANQGNGNVPVSLKVSQPHDRNDVAQVKRPGGGVKTNVTLQRPSGRGIPQASIGDLFDEPSLVQNINNVPGQNSLLT